jgi:hypothetical protein
MESKHDNIFDSSLHGQTPGRYFGFKKNWNNEVITQFHATVYFEENGDTRKLHWMTEGQWYEVSYAQFARLLGKEMRSKF